MVESRYSGGLKQSSWGIHRKWCIPVIQHYGFKCYVIGNCLFYCSLFCRRVTVELSRCHCFTLKAFSWQNIWWLLLWRTQGGNYFWLTYLSKQCEFKLHNTLYTYILYRQHLNRIELWPWITNCWFVWRCRCYPELSTTSFHSFEYILYSNGINVSQL